MFTLNCKGKLLEINAPVVMGILNVTPDSFYEGSRMKDNSDLLRNAATMIKDGAAIIDIGGQSTRPGSTIVPAEEELNRVLPAIKAISSKFPSQLISIDTFYARVAIAAIEAGAHIINDVSAGTLDNEMLPAAGWLKVPYVLMHMPGTPQTMQQTQYSNVTLNVFDFLNFKINELVISGVKDIIIDPGFGFGKNAPQTFELLNSLSYFNKLGYPVMAGLSRKATIYKTLNITAAEALNGTTVMHTIALMNGATILRVHDVKEAVEAITLHQAYKKAKEQLGTAL